MIMFLIFCALCVNAFLFIAAIQKYNHATRLLDETRKMAMRVLLIKGRK